MPQEQEKPYADAEEAARDWGCSKSQAYKIIRALNRQMKLKDPRLIAISGKANRQYYKECCYKRQ